MLSMCVILKICTNCSQMMWLTCCRSICVLCLHCYVIFMS